MSNDKRRRPRKHLDLPAWIDVGNDARLQRCTLVDMSDSGARLAVDDIESLPDKFLLALSRSGQPRQSCNVVWRRHDEIGIEFIASLRANARSSESIDAASPQCGNVERFTARPSYDSSHSATDRMTAHPGQSTMDDGVSARLLQKGLHVARSRFAPCATFDRNLKNAERSQGVAVIACEVRAFGCRHRALAA